MRSWPWLASACPSPLRRPPRQTSCRIRTHDSKSYVLPSSHRRRRRLRTTPIAWSAESVAVLQCRAWVNLAKGTAREPRACTACWPMRLRLRIVSIRVKPAFSSSPGWQAGTSGSPSSCRLRVTVAELQTCRAALCEEPWFTSLIM